jgi:hypothetical protein
MSQIHQDPDLAVEIFVLDPTGQPEVAEYHVDLSDAPGD